MSRHSGLFGPSTTRALPMADPVTKTPRTPRSREPPVAFRGLPRAFRHIPGTGKSGPDGRGRPYVRSTERGPPYVRPPGLRPTRRRKGAPDGRGRPYVRSPERGPPYVPLPDLRTPAPRRV